MTQKLIKVLVVDDSIIVRELLTKILESDPVFKVVGKATNGLEAIELNKLLKPDIITMDINMPHLDGYEATIQIMSQNPTPIVIVSSLINQYEIKSSYRFIEAGALAIVALPMGEIDSKYISQKEKLVQTLKNMAEIKVITRFNRKIKEPVIPKVIKRLNIDSDRDIKIIVIGASTGGPHALKTILSGLTPALNIPIAIVQHITDGFTPGFCEWLKNSSGYSVKIAVNGEYMKEGHAYVAPNGMHMSVDKNLRVILQNGENEYGVKPSVGHLFRETAKIFGEKAIGVLLTGMGKDGAVELKEMKDLNAITIVQNEESSVVFGMPGEAVKINADTYILNINDIAPAIKVFSKKPENHNVLKSKSIE